MSIDKDMLDAIQTLLEPITKRLDDMQADISDLKKGQTGTNERLTALEQGQQEQTEFERGTRILVENVNKNIRLLAEGHGANAAKLQQLDRMESTLNDVKSDTEVIKSVVSWHSEAIDRLKKA